MGARARGRKAVPPKPLAIEPPSDDTDLLGWLSEREEEHRAEIDAAWEVALGYPPPRR